MKIGVRMMFEISEMPWRTSGVRALPIARYA